MIFENNLIILEREEDKSLAEKAMSAGLSEDYRYVLGTLRNSPDRDAQLDVHEYPHELNDLQTELVITGLWRFFGAQEIAGRTKDSLLPGSLPYID